MEPGAIDMVQPTTNWDYDIICVFMMMSWTLYSLLYGGIWQDQMKLRAKF